MAGEIKLNNVSIATENAGTVTINNATLGNSMVLGTNASPIANNLVFANGNGIDFGATAGSGSSSNVLDDYEEGTWSPSITITSGFLGAATITDADYLKIGNFVTANCKVRFNSASGNLTAGDSFQISSFPFAAASALSAVSHYNYNITNGSIQYALNSSTTSIELRVTVIFGSPDRSGGTFNVQLHYIV